MGHARCYGESGGWAAGDGPCAVLWRERGMGGRRRAMRGAMEGAGDGWQATGLHRLRDRDPAEGGVCPIGGARGPLIAHANPMGGSVGAVPRGSPDTSVSIAAVCDHCITSHLVQYPS